jgi:hypothetical protein
MVAFKAFQPDPDLTDPEDEYFGTGTWTYDDGTSTYGQGDREQALSLLNQPPAQPDQRTAGVSPYGQNQTMAPPDPPGREALDANEPRADFSPPPMLARPPEQVSSAVDGSMGARPADETTGGINIPKSARIAYVHNNPGNLKFVGQDGASQGEPAEDGGHWAAFETPEDGVAALNRQIELDATRGKTVREFVTKYAPPNSNDTDTYIRQAAAALGGDPDAKLSDLDRSKVLAFMAQKESGTTLGGTSLPEQSAPRAAGLPPSMNGMPAAVAEMRGMPLSPDQMAARQQGILDQTMTQVAGVQQAAAERQRGREEALQVVAQQHERFKADQQAQLDQATRTKLEAEQNVQKAMATQLEPGRLIKNMSTGDAVLGIFALALGGLGQTLQQRGGQANARNGVVDMLERALNDDLEQQKEDKKSRVAHWTRVFGDSEMGIRAARAEMYNAAGQYAQFQAQSKVTNADIQGQMMQDSAALLAKGQQEAQGLVDKENERLTIRYQRPEPRAAVDAVESLQKKLATRKAYEEAGATPEELAGFDAAMGIPSPTGESTRQQAIREGKEKLAREEQTLTEAEGKAEAAHQTIGQLGETVGLKRDPKTNKWFVPEGADSFGWKLGKATELNAAREAAIDGLARLQTGAAISEAEEARYSKMLGNKSATMEEIVITLNSLDALLQSRRKQSRVTSGAPSTWKSQ